MVRTIVKVLTGLLLISGLSFVVAAFSGVHRTGMDLKNAFDDPNLEIDALLSGLDSLDTAVLYLGVGTILIALGLAALILLRTHYTERAPAS